MITVFWQKYGIVANVYGLLVYYWNMVYN